MHGVDGDLEAAVGTVLEADGTGQTRSEFAMALAFGGACADGAPADQVGNVLRADEIQELGGGGHPFLVEVQQQAAGQAQALVDMKALVHIGVIDQPLPADGGTRLFEVDPHNDAELPFQLVDQGFEATRVVSCGIDVVDRAGTNDDDQAVVLSMQNLVNGYAVVEYRLRGDFVNRKFGVYIRRRADLLDAGDTDVVCFVVHVVVVQVLV